MICIWSNREKSDRQITRYEKTGPEDMITRAFSQSITSTFSFLIWKLPYLSFLGDAKEDAQVKDKFTLAAPIPQRLHLEPVGVKTGRSNWIFHSIGIIST